MRKTPNIGTVMAMISIEIKNEHRVGKKLAQTGSPSSPLFASLNCHGISSMLNDLFEVVSCGLSRLSLILKITFPQVPIRKGLRAVYSRIGKLITLAISIVDLYLNSDLRSLASEIITAS